MIKQILSREWLERVASSAEQFCEKWLGSVQTMSDTESICARFRDNEGDAWIPSRQMFAPQKARCTPAGSSGPERIYERLAVFGN